MSIPSASSKIIFTMFKFFWVCSIVFKHSQIFWSWSKARFYLTNLHIWALSKIFERTEKILNMVKNIWTWPKKFWTSRWIKHWSKNYFSEKIWWTSEQICLFEWSTLYQWKTVLQIIIWKCWRTDAYCLHSHSGPGLSKIWLYFFKTTGKYCCFVRNDAYCLHSHSTVFQNARSRLVMGKWSSFKISNFFFFR